MRRPIVLPTSWKGWIVSSGFLLVIVAGVWPMIGWVNRATLVFGVPALVAWSYLIIFSCCAIMVLGNRLVGEDESDD
ncbi:hypothetical protein [Billgrantia saliphila]|uniref:hypothetical protein n=1 Tax=Billgrantia saliphila TaxID=1848458 RepID=UPI000CE5686F|nr:hypothetical protein [Halomonas saliphila]